MYAKIHKSGDRNIIAICDESLIGKKFSEGNLILDITERFYKGEVLTGDQTLELMKDALNLNIVGEKSIALALKNGIIEKDSVIKINGVPHAQVYQL
jgi:uncharacterized protein